MAKRRIAIFKDLKQALEDAREFEQGRRVPLRVAEVPPPPKRPTPRQIREIRRALNASQAVFGLLLNVSARAVQSWEQGERKPDSAAVKLLAIARRNPRVLLQG